MERRSIDRFTLLYGKTPLIVFAVLICSVSFILGYFVGKSVNEPEVVMSKRETKIQERKPAQPQKQKKEPSTVKKAESKPVEPLSKPEQGITQKPKETLTERPFPIQGKSINYYTIQVGAFSSKKEAEGLKNRLTRKGYTVFINTSKRGKILYRVRVGRFIKRSDAEEAALKLRINEKLKTFIVTVKKVK